MYTKDTGANNNCYIYKAINCTVFIDTIKKLCDSTVYIHINRLAFTNSY